MFVFGGISEEIGKEHLVLRYIRSISTKSYTIRLSKYSKRVSDKKFLELLATLAISMLGLINISLVTTK